MDILNGLSEIHKNNIIHCDIKPHNFLLFKSDEGEDDVMNSSFDLFDPHILLKITDFGLAHAIKLGDDRAHMKYKCGTFNYTAPEVKDVSPYLYRIHILISR